MSQKDGYLPSFLLFTAFLALLHSTICYFSPTASLSPFSGPLHPPHTPLLAHIYGVLNFFMGAIRLLAARDIRNKALYDLALGTFVGVVWLLGSEMVWGTVGLNGVGVPLGVTGVGVGWMVRERRGYVG